MCVMVTCLLSPSVTLRLVSGETCSGDDWIFSCEASGTGLLQFTITGLPNLVAENFFSKRHNIERVTSSDDTLGPNPSKITIHNVTAADSGATVQCRIQNGDMSNIITLSIRE